MKKNFSYYEDNTTIQVQKSNFNKKTLSFFPLWPLSSHHDAAHAASSVLSFFF